MNIIISKRSNEDMNIKLVISNINHIYIMVALLGFILLDDAFAIVTTVFARGLDVCFEIATITLVFTTDFETVVFGSIFIFL